MPNSEIKKLKKIIAKLERRIQLLESTSIRAPISGINTDGPLNGRQGVYGEDWYGDERDYD